jgi:hypothetical protein
MKTFFLHCLFICFLSSNVSFAQSSNEKYKSELKASTYQSVDQLPSVSVKYVVQNKTQKQEWFMDRKINTIATFNGMNQQGEVWTRNQNGEIEYTRLFFKEKKLVEYTTGELKTQNIFPNWTKLASMFNPKDIELLKRVDKRNLFGKDVVVLEGEINKIQTVIWWIPELQIPAYVQQKQGNVDWSMSLKEIFTQTPSSWQWADQATLDNFSKIDASDIGDMESDPFVKKLLEMEGHHH